MSSGQADRTGVVHGEEDEEDGEAEKAGYEPEEEVVDMALKGESVVGGET